MSSNNGIEVVGLDSLLDTLKAGFSEESVTKALGKCCAIVERAAKQNAPKGNGELRRSITSKVENLEGIIYTPLEYAPYVEYGTGLFAEEGGRQEVPWHYKDDEGNWHSTSGMHPHPYMRPALSENIPQIKEILREAINSND